MFILMLLWMISETFVKFLLNDVTKLKPMFAFISTVQQTMEIKANIGLENWQSL